MLSLLISVPVPGSFATGAPVASSVVDAPAPLHHSGSPAPGQPAPVLTFTPGFNIVDQNFYSHNAMSESQIQAFLDAKIGTCLSSKCLNVLRVNLLSYRARTSETTGLLRCSAVTGGSNLRASTVIYRVQQACGLSARVILVTLQKEQGLV